MDCTLRLITRLGIIDYIMILKEINLGKIIYDERGIDERIKKVRQENIRMMILGILLIIISLFFMMSAVNLLSNARNTPPLFLVFFGFTFLILGFISLLSYRVNWFLRIYEKGLTLPVYNLFLELIRKEWVVPFSSIQKIDWRKTYAVYFWIKIPIQTSNINEKYKIKKLCVMSSDIHDFDKFEQLCQELIPAKQISD